VALRDGDAESDDVKKFVDFIDNGLLSEEPVPNTKEFF
jgi:hypothetical protein